VNKMSDGTPPWAYEQPAVHPHDPRLIEQAEVERARLAELLGPWLANGANGANAANGADAADGAAGVEHVGSTSVPGLAAKPIIDLMAQVIDLDTVVDEAGGQLWAAGWHYVPPDLDGRRWRRFFVKPDPSGQHRYAHLHVIQAGHPRWAQQIAFRDALRRDDDLARRYGDLKRGLAAEHPADREAYTEAKAEFITQALGQQARE
jgi:GrpB-like predicted nucleotidyltransferase (UPF0157 family)